MFSRRDLFQIVGVFPIIHATTFKSLISHLPDLNGHLLYYVYEDPRLSMKVSKNIIEKFKKDGVPADRIFHTDGSTLFAEMCQAMRTAKTYQFDKKLRSDYDVFLIDNVDIFASGEKLKRNYQDLIWWVLKNDKKMIVNFRNKKFKDDDGEMLAGFEILRV